MIIGDTSAALRNIGLTLPIVSELDRRILVERPAPDEVARDWLTGAAHERRPPRPD